MPAALARRAVSENWRSHVAASCPILPQGLPAAVTEVEIIDDESGTPHPWREELARQLIQMQQKDGSWVNSRNDRWMEGDRQLVTAYALLALAYCQH